jgi:hypothetical protein
MFLEKLNKILSFTFINPCQKWDCQGFVTHLMTEFCFTYLLLRMSCHMPSLVSKFHNHLLSKQIFITCKSCHFFLIFVHICSSLGETWPCRSHGYLCDLVRSRKDGCCRTIKRIQLCTTWHVASSPVVRPYCIWYAQEVAWFTQTGHLHYWIIQVWCIVA